MGSYGSSNTGYSFENTEYVSGNTGYSGSSYGNSVGSSNTGYSPGSGSSYSNGASSSGSVSSGSLKDVFGDGKSFAVKVQTPEYQVQYDANSVETTLNEGYSAQSNSGGYSSGSSSGYSSGSSGYSSGSSGALSNIFGDGQIQAVKIELPRTRLNTKEDNMMAGLVAFRRQPPYSSWVLFNVSSLCIYDDNKISICKK